MYPYRLSYKPNKQFLYLLVQRDMRNLKGDIGVELGCSRMQNYPAFRTRKYYGVDIDSIALDAGKKRFPDAIPVNARIEVENSHPKADVILCVQVFMTSEFDEEKSTQITSSIIKRINKNGSLIINFGKSNKPYIKEIRELLKSSFKDVREQRTGLHSKYTGLWAPFVASKAMLFGPPSGLPEEKRGKWYFRCTGRL